MNELPRIYAKNPHLRFQTRENKSCSLILDRPSYPSVVDLSSCTTAQDIYDEFIDKVERVNPRISSEVEFEDVGEIKKEDAQ